MKIFYSHKNKPLAEHLDGVVRKTKNRTHLKIAEIAALFHDLGKINPNFQRRLDGEKNLGYSSHAYLSALAWLCFFESNREKAKEILDGNFPLLYSVAAMIARHHGDLPNMEEGFFHPRESENLEKFLKQISEDLPISEFLQSFLTHTGFPVKLNDEYSRHLLFTFPLKFRDSVSPKISDKLEFFINTQYGFACLLESDKRDAGENEIFNRKEKGGDYKQKFDLKLKEKLDKLTQKNAAKADAKKQELDILRSQMRETALENLRELLSQNKRNPQNEKRVFSLPAPTGAGKTLMLLSLAAEILKHDQNLSIIYALPFLAITEQTESICQEILGNRDEVLRIDSKSENLRLETIQRDLDANPTEENLRDFSRECFAQNTFDHPFIITTFVQIFETLVSNRNAKLLRLPNFSRTVFLLDEIQALPPNLYTFFVAYLDEFCRKFDSYAIVSTATMPHLEMPNDNEAKTVFRRYEKPATLLNDDFYDAAPFNRYRIKPKPEIDSIEKLADEIRELKKSCLVVLNTVKDTKELFAILSGTGEDDSEEGEYVLLNTHFTLIDRQRKLALCKERLKNGERIVLISTQLIEAGVDIDFPTLYRDMCPLPSLIQSAGRCNRNNRLEAGDVYLFEIRNDKGKSSADLIYGRNFDWFLAETRKSINCELTEKDMLRIQQIFAQKVSDNLIFGQYQSASETLSLVECINRSAFADFAKVRLIDEEYGKEFRYYVPANYSDYAFDDLEEIVEQSKFISPRDFDRIKVSRQKIENHLRRISAQIINLRVTEKQVNELTHLGSEEICGIRRLASLDYYSPITGIKIKTNEGCIF